MTNNILRKSLVIGFIILFIGASIIPSISGNIAEENKVMEKKINLEEYRGSLFEDDFNDNSKDHDKWTEFFDEGLWLELNQRTEFRLDGTGDSLSEGISSIYVPVTVTQDLSIIISVDMITKIGSNIDTGELHFKVNDGQNWLWTVYRRDNNQLMFKDSNDPDWTNIGTRGDGSWNNKIEIFSDRYFVQLDGFNSGWISDSLFSSSSQINMELFIVLDASSDYYIISGYDNAKIGVENQPPNKPNKPSGPTSGKVGTSYTYETSTTDPDLDQIWYMFDWDDDTPLEWDGPYESGVTSSFSHSWDSTGTYRIKVKAKDTYDAESDWSETLGISIPKSRVTTNIVFKGLIKQFPNLFPVIKILMQVLIPK